MLLFFDIDGTLFDDRHQLPASVRPAMDQARQNGHSLFVNTGRTLCNMDHRLDGFPLDGWVMGCGTRIILHGKTLQSMEYSLRESMNLVGLLRSHRLPAVYECDTGMYFDPEGTSHPALSHLMRFSEDHRIRREVSDRDPEFRIVKMLLFSARPEPVQLFCAEAGRLGMPYTAIDRGQEAWEMVPSGYSKAGGIDRICLELGRSAEDCMAFGDSSNDLSMLLAVKYSIAMGNAPEDVKARCFHVTDRPEKDGIANAMRKFGII